MTAVLQHQLPNIQPIKVAEAEVVTRLVLAGPFGCLTAILGAVESAGSNSKKRTHHFAEGRKLTFDYDAFVGKTDNQPLTPNYGGQCWP